MSFLMISLFIGWVVYVDLIPNARSFDIDKFDRIHGTSFHDKDYFFYKEDRFTLRDLYYEYYFFSGRLSPDSGYSNVTVIDKIIDFRTPESAYPMAAHSTLPFVSFEAEVIKYLDPEEEELFHPMFHINFHRDGSTYSIRIHKNEQYTSEGSHSLSPEDLDYIHSFLNAILFEE